MATFCTVCVRVSGVWNIWCGYVLYSLCASVWCLEYLVWLRFVQFEWGVSGVWDVAVATVHTVCVGECPLCGLTGMATFCTVCVGSVWCVECCCGYDLYRLVGSVWCVECFVWLRSVHFVWTVSAL